MCLVYMPADRQAMGALTLGWDQARTHPKTWAPEKLVNVVIAYEFLSHVDQLTVDKNMGTGVFHKDVCETAKIQASRG